MIFNIYFIVSYIYHQVELYRLLLDSYRPESQLTPTEFLPDFIEHERILYHGK